MSHLKIFAELERDYKAHWGHEKWPACGDVAEWIGNWLSARGHPVYVEEGYMDGREDLYHRWVEVTIGRERWIVDGARKQFEQLTGDSRSFAVFAKSSKEGRDYVPASEIESFEAFGEMRDVAGDPAFRRWFGDSKVVDANGLPRVVFHGTTHSFEEFKLDRGNPENHFGRAFYFTSSEEDASGNYAGEGPDLTSRIEQLAERIFQEKEDAAGGHVRYGSRAYEQLMSASRRAARRQLAGGAVSVMPVYLKIENPLVLEPYGGTTIQLEFEYDAEGEIVSEKGNALDLLAAIVRVAEDHGLAKSRSMSEAAAWLGERVPDGLPAWAVDEYLHHVDDFFEVADDEGRSLANDMIGEIWRSLGFDGIIQNAHAAFPTMKMPPDTKHFIVWKPTQVKSVFNRGAWDPADPSILAGAGDDDVIEISDLGDRPSRTREEVFEAFKDAVRLVWRNADFVLPRLELSQEPPRDPTVYAAVERPRKPTPVAIGNSIVRAAPWHRLHVADRLLTADDETVRRILIHEAVHLGYPGHGDDFRRMVREHGGTVSERGLTHDEIRIQQKVGGRYQTIRTFGPHEERAALAWGREQAKANPGIRYRMVQ